MATTSMNAVKLAPVQDISLSKESLMARNIHLLGFHVEDVSDMMPMGSKMPRGQSNIGINTTGINSLIHSNMFDRPNEKLLFRVLYFLLSKISPGWKADIRFCWPLTSPQDKTNFKKHVQSFLYELEKAGHLPLGSSQASRINSGCGPRLIDLIWRLSTYAVRVTLESLPAYKVVPPPSTENASVTEAIMALKAKIAMKTHRIQEKCVERSQVQDKWVNFASELSNAIHDLNTIQSQIQEDQAKLNAQVSPQKSSKKGHPQRQMAIESIQRAWKMIEHFTTSSGLLNKQALLLDKAHTNCQDQPVLNKSMIIGDQEKHRQTSRMDLTQIIHDAELILRATFSRFFHGKVRMVLEKQDAFVNTSTTMSTTTSTMALLKSTIEQFKQLVDEINQNNQHSIRKLYIDQVTNSSTGSTQFGLCPPTPVSPNHEDVKKWEDQLSASLQKASLHELSDLAANSIRNSSSHSKWKKRCKSDDNIGNISRRLEYNTTIEEEDDEKEQKEEMQF